MWEKEPAVANELANDVVGRLLSKPFVESSEEVNYQLVGLAMNVLSDYMREPSQKGITYEESPIRSLAMKTIAFYLERSGRGYIASERVEVIAKRFSPASLPAIKRADDGGSHKGRQVLANDVEYTKLMASNPSVETMLSAAKQFPSHTRSSIYMSAASKLSDAGQYDRARAMLSENFDDQALDTQWAV